MAGCFGQAGSWDSLRQFLANPVSSLFVSYSSHFAPMLMLGIYLSSSCQPLSVVKVWHACMHEKKENLYRILRSIFPESGEFALRGLFLCISTDADSSHIS